MNKFGRNYNLAIQLADKDILNIKPPFTLEFDVKRNVNSSASSATFRIYNLSNLHRNLIRYNQYNIGDVRTIVFQAGYGSNLSTAHAGQIQLAMSYREGSNFITEITSFDGGHAYQTSQYPQTIDASPQSPVTKVSIIRNLIQQLPLVSQGAVGDYIGMYYRPYSFNNSTVDSLREECGKGFFVDNGVAHCLQDNEYIVANYVPLINSASGLLGTPKLQLNLLTFDMLFEPSLFVGQQIQLQSSTFADNQGNNLNGFYKINSLSHHGTISPVVCGEAVTSCGMYYDAGQMKPVVLP